MERAQSVCASDTFFVCSFEKLILLNFGQIELQTRLSVFLKLPSRLLSAVVAATGKQIKYLITSCKNYS